MLPLELLKSMGQTPNFDSRTVRSFGDEWTRFDQDPLDDSEAERIFNQYFEIFPWHLLPPRAVGFDMGCGSGRWSRFVANRVGILHCIDPSSSLSVARRQLAHFPNILFHNTSVSASGLPLDSQDFGFSLGVLHHVPSTSDAIRSCVDLLKPGAPLLLYLYYAFDNRPRWYRTVWYVSNILRLIISRLPSPLKTAVTDLIATLVYFPLSRFSLLLDSLGMNVSNIPLSYYRHCSYYTLRTDARDRFGTPLEQRFTRSEITNMCTEAGLVNIKFSSSAPYWCVVGFKRSY